MLRDADSADMARDLLASMGFSKAETASAVYALSLPADHRYAQIATWENGGKLPETYGMSADKIAELRASQGISDGATFDTARDYLPWLGTTVSIPKWRGVPSAKGIDPRDVKEMGGFGSRYLDTDDRRDLVRAANAYRDCVGAHFAWWHTLSKRQRKDVRRDQRRESWQCPVCKGNCAIYDRGIPTALPERAPVVGSFTLRCAAVSKSIQESIEVDRIVFDRIRKGS